MSWRAGSAYKELLAVEPKWQHKTFLGQSFNSVCIFKVLTMNCVVYIRSFNSELCCIYSNFLQWTVLSILRFNSVNCVVYIPSFNSELCCVYSKFEQWTVLCIFQVLTVNCVVYFQSFNSELCCVFQVLTVLLVTVSCTVCIFKVSTVNCVV